MKKFNEMTDEEFNALAAEVEKEKTRRIELIERIYNNKMKALSKIEDAFNDYFYEFNEWPLAKVCDNISPVPTSAAASIRNKTCPNSPYLIIRYQ